MLLHAVNVKRGETGTTGHPLDRLDRWRNTPPTGQLAGCPAVAAKKAEEREGHINDGVNVTA